MTSEICHLTIDGENLKDFIVDTVIHLITGGEVKKDTKLPVKEIMPINEMFSKQIHQEEKEKNYTNSKNGHMVTSTPLISRLDYFS